MKGRDERYGFSPLRSPRIAAPERPEIGGNNMRMTISVGVAFGMLLVAAVPIQAAHKHAHKYWRHAHVTDFAAPRRHAETYGQDVAAPKFCTYMGGPKSTLLAC